MLGLASVAFFAHLTVGGQVLFWGIPLLQLYPWRSFAVAEYLAGRVPLWNPYAGFGMPLAANVQAAVFYPLNAHYLLLPVERAQTLSLVLHVALAGALAYGLCRSFGLARWPSLGGGLAYMFSGFIVAQSSFHNVVSVLAWAPAPFWGVNAVLAARDRRAAARAAAGLALATAMLCTAGFIQYAYYALVAAAAYGAYRLWPWLPGWRTALGRGWPAAAGVGAGLLLAAVQLVPTLELARYSVRQQGLEYADATSASLWPGLLLTTLVPGLFGSQPTNDWRAPGTPYEGVLFLGALPLLAAVLGLRSGVPHARFFGGLAAVGLALALGRYNPLFPWLHDWAPGLSLFHAPARFALWYVLGVAVLAAVGLHAVQAAPTGTRTARLAIALGGTTAAVGLMGMAMGTGWLAAAGAAGAAGGLWLAGAGALVLLRARAGGPRWGALAAGFIGLNLAALGHNLTPGVDARLYTEPPSPQVARLQAEAGLDRSWVSDQGYLAAQQHFFNFSGFWITDAERLLEMRERLLPNLSTPLGIHEVHNYDPLKLARSGALQGAVQDRGFPPHLLDLMGVRYLPHGSGVTAPEARPLETAAPAPIRERAAPLPRAFVAPGALRADAADEALHRVLEPGFDPRRTAVVEAPAEVALPSGGGSFRPATVREYGTQRVVVEAETGPGGGVLVLTDAYYPGWQVTVDGALATAYPTNVAFRGVPLPPGEHTVVFAYRPGSFVLGVAGSLLGLLLLAGMAAYGFAGRGRGR